MTEADQAREEVSEFQKQIGALREEIGRVIVGEHYPGDVRKAPFRDPDGGAIGFGSGPMLAVTSRTSDAV